MMVVLSLPKFELEISNTIHSMPAILSFPLLIIIIMCLFVSFHVYIHPNTSSARSIDLTGSHVRSQTMRFLLRFYTYDMIFQTVLAHKSDYKGRSE